MASNLFASFLDNLQKLGFYDFVLPWLLFFAIILGVLNKSGLIGDKKTNTIIAAVIAFFIVNFIPPGGISAFYSQIFGIWGMLGSVLLVLVLLIGVLGFKPEDFLVLSQKEAGGESKKSPTAYAIVGLVLVILAYLVYAQTISGAMGALTLGSDIWTLIFVAVFILLVIWFATSGKQPEKKAGE